MKYSEEKWKAVSPNFRKCSYCLNYKTVKEFESLENSHVMDTCKKCCNILDKIQALISKRDSSEITQEKFEFERNLLLSTRYF